VAGGVHGKADIVLVSDAVIHQYLDGVHDGQALGVRAASVGHRDGSLYTDLLGHNRAGPVGSDQVGDHSGLTGLDHEVIPVAVIGKDHVVVLVHGLVNGPGIQDGLLPETIGGLLRRNSGGCRGIILFLILSRGLVYQLRILVL